VRAWDSDLDRVYEALLACPELRLARDHREQLLRRGLSPDDVERNGYRSLPTSCRASIGRRLREQFSDRLLLSVPGIIVRDGRHGRYLTIAGAAGVAIPLRSTERRIVGIVIRPDDPGRGGKYRWFSSAKHGGPAARVGVHVPSASAPSQWVVIVEGVLKADVAAALWGRAVIGLPGCHVTDAGVQALRALGARQPLLALDADTTANYHVALAQAEGLRRLKGAGFDAGVIRWHRDLGKGLDDALLALRLGRADR
jgi:hypothetical protein